MKNKQKIIFPVAALVVLVVVLGMGFMSGWFSNPTTKTEFHEHTNFAVYLNGVQYNFNQSKYMINSSDRDSSIVHMHDLNGGTIHIEAPEITMGFFLKTLGMSVNSTCFVLDNGTAYCNSGDKTLKMYVNGVKSNLFDKQPLRDLDKILISFGNDSSQEIQKRLSTIPSDACIHSKKCPAPPGYVDTESLTCKTGEAAICSG
ncbi:MAG: hypothetical protein J4452_01585 [Candidatus Aenigmarchaeota archaeon]|nr:hypothetical protein [Candidatus Aenigmarchaeota archaeon]